MRSISFTSPFLLGLATVQASNLVSVATSSGTVQGGQCVNSNANYFVGIPFAQPPIGDLRFEAPQPYNATYPSGTLLATSPPPACIQFGKQFVETTATSEDCLYLDIWTPPNTTSTSGLPVKVWIHGGDNDAGGISNPLYNGCNLAVDDAILVSINYRVGPLGFLALASAGIDGNFGLKDILLGLHWVQSNIVAFGGDPTKVLLFGQNAGASSSFIISTLPEAPSLINAMVAESGGGQLTQAYNGSQKLGSSFAKSINCGLSDTACIKSTPVSAMKGDVGVGSSNQIDFGPHMDGKLIPAQPWAVGVQVPSIFGTSALEGSAFIFEEYQSLNITPAQYKEYIEGVYSIAAPLVEKAYPISAFNSTPYPAFNALSTILTDQSYKCPAYRALNRAEQKGIPVWTYLFEHSPSCQWLPELLAEAGPFLGATHTAEIPFVFGNLNRLPTPNGTCDFTDGEKEISHILVNVWTSMAATGKASGDASAFQWPRYSISQSLGVNINASVTAGVVDYSMCDFWDMIYQLQLNSIGSNDTIVGVVAAGPNVTASGGNGTTTGNAVPSAYTGGVAGFASSSAIALVMGATAAVLSLL